MQNLYMMAALIREQQMLKMANEVNLGLITIEQAMMQYNVSTPGNVMKRVEVLNEEKKCQSVKDQSEIDGLNVWAA